MIVEPMYIYMYREQIWLLLMLVNRAEFYTRITHRKEL